MSQKNIFKRLLLLSVFGLILIASYGQEKESQFQKCGIFELFEISIGNDRSYTDPFCDVELLVELSSPDGKKRYHYGFYDGIQTWKVRFCPDILGEWKYQASFSDQSNQISGAFTCSESHHPGKVSKNELNPFWLGKQGEPKTMFRSFHVGDRFFAENWDDPKNENDGNLRTQFLDWLQENKYNMLSIGSLFTNRNEKGRGEGWNTPQLWPLNPDEFRKLEVILDELEKRNITIFPFAGFFGAKGNWPTNAKDQELYIKYLLARIGHYPNLILSVAGPEPFWREDKSEYKGAMRLADIKRLGNLIDSLDVHNHIITLHNEKRATQYGDPFIDEPWYDMSTLQGPTTLNREDLYSGLSMNHHRSKPVFAQETLWSGNMFHPKYTDDQLRKNAYTILFSGSILNFADMDGNSSTGFTGTLNLNAANQQRHEVVKRVWDWFETIPFHQMTTRQDLVNHGFCLAKEGQEYYIYLDTIGKTEITPDFEYPLYSEWINAKNPLDKRAGPVVRHRIEIQSPKDGDDWILHLFAAKPEVVAYGNFPDLCVDHAGNIHLVYNRAGLRYKMYDIKIGRWSEEQEVSCNCENVMRSDPDVVVDSKGKPHVFCGNEYAFFDGQKWQKSVPGGIRDTELAIDKNDRVFLASRGGNNGGYIGIKMKTPGKDWKSLTDPDQKHKGPNDHVYTDLFIGNKNQIHLVQRHGPEVEVTYRSSTDGGQNWEVEEAVSNERTEAPHIVAERSGKVFIATGNGSTFERNGPGNWKSIGRRINCSERMQPEWSIDDRDNLYLTCFGGRFNTRNKGVWTGEGLIDRVTEKNQIGFVETFGSANFAYMVWEEGDGNPNQGLNEEAAIVVSVIYPDGCITGLSAK